jgi:heme exporter protein C
VDNSTSFHPHSTGDEMNMPLVVLIVGLGLAFRILLGVWGASIMRDKGRPESLGWLFGVVLGVVGIAICSFWPRNAAHPPPGRSGRLAWVQHAIMALASALLVPIWNARWVLLPPLTGVTMMAMIASSVLAAPREIIEGEVQRLMYIHVPSATLSYLAFSITAFASAVLLIRHDMRWDAIARGAATVGVMLTAFALLTGAIWGKPIWGTYWSWDARLTATLVLFLIYSGYLLARAVGGPNDEQAARYAAVVGLIGYLDIPLIHFSVDWWRTLHPQRIILSPKPALPGEMLLVLLIGFTGILFLVLWLILLRSTTEYLVQRADRVRARLDQLERA